MYILKFKNVICSSLLFLSASVLVANANAANDWDMDNSGEVDALTDGLLMLRYSFGLRGETLTNSAISADSSLTAAEVLAEISAAQSISDIDGDGSVNALTDGLLLLRYLFGLSGDALISGVVSSEATRSSVSDISQYIDSYMLSDTIVDPDNDSVADANDAFPEDPNETADSDNDGVGDNADYAPNDPTVHSAPGSNWVAGEYLPSRNFANKCVNRRFNADYQDLFGTYADENNWIRSWSHETYLWYNELPDIDPASIQDTKEYFNQMKTTATTSNGSPKDRFHYTQNTEDYNQYAQTGVSAGYGFTYILSQSIPPRRAIIIYSQIGSPAANKGIRRGAEIISIDGENLIDGDPAILNAGLTPSELGENHTFVIKDLNSDINRTINLQSSAITENPINTLGVIERTNTKIGYIALNTFATATAEKILVDTITNLKQNQIDELVLDLRYNGGGFLAISAQLSTMIAGIEASNQTFTELIYNDKKSAENTAYPFPTQTFGIAENYSSGIPLPTLDLSRVYIISSNNTASASESLINGLRGIDFEVILIGGSTTGKPYGWLPEENCGTTYSTIQFKGVNTKGFGDYADGFIPSLQDNGTDQVQGCVVYEDIKHLLGDKNEKMLGTAIYHIENGNCPTNTVQARAKSSQPFENFRGGIIRRYPATGFILQ